MKPDAKVQCRLVLAVLPVSLAKAVAADPRICEVAGLTQGAASSGLSIDLAEISKVISRAGFDETEQIAIEAGTFPLRRTRDGVVIGQPGMAEPTQLLLEAGLLDPDVLVRRSSFERIAKGIWPMMQTEDRWRHLVEERPLSPGEVVAVIATRDHSPRRFLEAFEAKPEFAIEELVPESIEYFEALIGESPADREYELDDLLAHLNIAVRRDAYWGWRLVRAAFIGNVFSPARSCAPVDGKLLQDFLARDRYVTPASVLAALELRLHDGGTAADPPASPSARELYALLEKPEVAAAAHLAVAIFRLAFMRLAFMDSRSSATWRRVAALVHSNLMAEVLSDVPDLAQAIHARCSMFGAMNVAAEAWDLKGAPLWQAGLAILADPVVVAIARGKNLLARAAAANSPAPADVQPEEHGAVDEMWIGLRLGAAPLQVEEDPVREGAQVLGVDDVGLAQFQTSWTLANWNVLLAYARMGVLGRDVIAAIDAQLSSGVDSFSLTVAARIAVAQRSGPVAAAVRSACTAAMAKADEANDVALTFNAATLVAAVHPERWSDFLDALFSEFAVSVRRGKPAQALVLMMEALLQLVPWEQRQWRGALGMARCAA